MTSGVRRRVVKFIVVRRHEVAAERVLLLARVGSVGGRQRYVRGHREPGCTAMVTGAARRTSAEAGCRQQVVATGAGV